MKAAFGDHFDHFFHDANLLNDKPEKILPENDLDDKNDPQGDNEHNKVIADDITDGLAFPGQEGGGLFGKFMAQLSDFRLWLAGESVY